jgi:hypothetical protein
MAHKKGVGSTPQLGATRVQRLGAKRATGSWHWQATFWSVSAEPKSIRGPMSASDRTTPCFPWSKDA